MVVNVVTHLPELVVPMLPAHVDVRVTEKRLIGSGTLHGLLRRAVSAKTALTRQSGSRGLRRRAVVARQLRAVVIVDLNDGGSYIQSDLDKFPHTRQAHRGGCTKGVETDRYSVPHSAHEGLGGDLLTKGAIDRVNGALSEPLQALRERRHPCRSPHLVPVEGQGQAGDADGEGGQEALAVEDVGGRVGVVTHVRPTRSVGGEGQHVSSQGQVQIRWGSVGTRSSRFESQPQQNGPAGASPGSSRRGPRHLPGSRGPGRGGRCGRAPIAPRWCWSRSRRFQKARMLFCPHGKPSPQSSAGPESSMRRMPSTRAADVQELVQRVSVQALKGLTAHCEAEPPSAVASRMMIW